MAPSVGTPLVAPSARPSDHTLTSPHRRAGSTNDFSLQFAGEDFSLDEQQLTVVAPDLPGHSRSAAPDDAKCEPSIEFFELCSRVCVGLMAKLGHRTYSVGGWSDGARVATLIAATSGASARVNSLLLWSFAPIMDRQFVAAIARTRDTKTWPRQALEFHTKSYEEAKFGELWRKYVDYCVSSLEAPPTFDLGELAQHIKCPTLLLHGSEDPFVSCAQHVLPLESRIPDSQVLRLAGARHNYHQSNPKSFKLIAERFVLGNSAAA